MKAQVTVTVGTHAIQLQASADQPQASACKAEGDRSATQLLSTTL